MQSGQTVEIQADSVEEAIALAREQMGLAGDTELRVEVLEDAKEGFFLGFGSRKAKIKVSIDGEESDEDYPEDEEVTASIIDEDEPWRMSQDEKQAAREMIEDFLALVSSTLGLEIRKEIMVRNDRVAVNIDGGDVGILIGKDGQTLSAIQYLLSIILSRNLAHKLNVDLDISGYKIRKRGRLERMARDAARRSIRTGQQIVLEPMDSQDRKTVHMTLRNSRDVETFSEGDGDDRRVIVSPRRRGVSRTSERSGADRGPSDRGSADRGNADRGSSDRSRRRPRRDSRTDNGPERATTAIPPASDSRYQEAPAGSFEDDGYDENLDARYDAQDGPDYSDEAEGDRGYAGASEEPVSGYEEQDSEDGNGWNGGDAEDDYDDER